jgi:hypothetical protein
MSFTAHGANDNGPYSEEPREGKACPELRPEPVEGLVEGLSRTVREWGRSQRWLRPS